MRLNVRCCCQPQKILGTMELASSARTQRFPMMQSEGRVSYVEVQLKPFIDYTTGERVEELAVYSDDRPVEFWRQFPSFKEAA